MINRLKNIAKNHLINIPGWRTDRKIVVIESDDWGMIRMASEESYEWFLKNGYKVNKCAYNTCDAIESNEDLELLFEVLDSVKDLHGNPAVFTANNIVANPDFEKIKESGFKEYFYEPFTQTLKKYAGRNRVYDLYKKGIEKKLFRPQFHGREHLNVNRWMSELRSGNKRLQDAFKQNMFTVHKSGKMSCRRDYLDAFGISPDREWGNASEIIKTGLDLFEDIWGYRSTSFVAPCYVWPVEIEGTLAANDVKYIQGTHVQRIPDSDQELNFRKKYHYLGQSNQLGQRYLVRNVSFEPAENGEKNSVDKALNQIKIAFKYNKPAIISSHRLNYIGSIKLENRDQNLKLLRSLLNQIVKQFPDVEFISSDELGNIIIGEN